MNFVVHNREGTCENFQNKVCRNSRASYGLGVSLIVRSQDIPFERLLEFRETRHPSRNLRVGMARDDVSL